MSPSVLLCRILAFRFVVGLLLGLAALTALVLVLQSCLRTSGAPREWPELKQEIRERFPRAPQLSTGELREWLAAPPTERPLLLDGRAPEEYAVSHLMGAVSTPNLETALEAVRAASPGQPVVVYCSVGWRSSALVEQLADHGVERVWNLEGSIFEWANQGRTVVRNGEPVRQVHPFDEDWGRFLDRDLWAFEPSDERSEGEAEKEAGEDTGEPGGTP